MKYSKPMLLVCILLLTVTNLCFSLENNSTDEKIQDSDLLVTNTNITDYSNTTEHVQESENAEGGFESLSIEEMNDVLKNILESIGLNNMPLDNNMSKDDNDTTTVTPSERSLLSEDTPLVRRKRTFRKFGCRKGCGQPNPCYQCNQCGSCGGGQQYHVPVQQYPSYPSQGTCQRCNGGYQPQYPTGGCSTCNGGGGQSFSYSQSSSSSSSSSGSF